MKIEEFGHYYFLRTEGKMSVEWLEEVVGLKLTCESTEDSYSKGGYSCGSEEPYSTYSIEEDGGTVYIHTDRICTTGSPDILERILDCLIHRPDLVGKL